MELKKAKTKIYGDEPICSFPLLPNEEDNNEFNLKINDLLKYRDTISDEQFGFYLAGLLEGDGCAAQPFIKYAFHIYDTNLAVYIRDRLGEGHIYKKDGNYVELIICKKSAITKFLNLVNGKFYTNCKLNAMKKYNYESRFGVTLLPPLDSKIHPFFSNYFLTRI